MDSKIADWRDDGKHLPEFLRDFHDQKDFFKFLYDTVDVEGNSMTKDVNWVAAHVFTIDILLWKLAQYGYTLQKNKTKLEFDDIHAAISKNDAERRSQFYQALLGAKPPNNPQE